VKIVPAFLFRAQFARQALMLLLFPVIVVNHFYFGDGFRLRCYWWLKSKPTDERCIDQAQIFLLLDEKLQVYWEKQPVGHIDQKFLFRFVQKAVLLLFWGTNIQNFSFPERYKNNMLIPVFADRLISYHIFPAPAIFSAL